MRYIMAFVWSFLLVTMLNYVAGSIAGVPFNLMGGVIAAIVMAVIILFITAATPEGEVADH